MDSAIMGNLEENNSPIDIATIESAIATSASVDCGFSSECIWDSPDVGLSISISGGGVPGNSSFLIDIESSRDTQISLSPFVAVNLQSAALVVDAFEVEGNSCSAIVCRQVDRDLTAGRSVFISARQVGGLNGPQRNNIETVALEYSEQGGAKQYAVFKNLANNFDTVFCSSGFPCRWSNENNDLQIDLVAVFPQPNETISLEIGDGALTAQFLIRNYTSMTPILTSVGGPNDFVALNGLVDYQLFNIQRAVSSSSTLPLIAEQDFRDPDIGLAVRQLESPREDLYSLLLTIPSGRMASSQILEELSLSFENEQGETLDRIEYKQISY